MSSIDDGPMTEHDMDHVVEHRTSYYISFFLVLLIFFFNFFIIFDRILVFDVMLHLISPTRREAASPPSPPQLHSISAVTLRNLQLHAVNTVTLRIPFYLIFKRGSYFEAFGSEV
jgi:hypothetical protein